MMFVRLALVPLLLAAPVSAEPTQMQRAQINGLWAMALDQWSPWFTCGAMNPSADVSIRKAWAKTSAQALKAMQAADWPAADLEIWRTKSNPDTMRLPDDTPFAEVLSYCTRNDDWLMRAVRLKGLPIGDEVEKALASGGNP